MRIKKIQIKNFKSLVDFELEDLKPFCAFVGPNASGKSNIFEALEFTNYLSKFSIEAASFFGGKKYIFSFNSKQIDEVFSMDDVIYFDLQFLDRIRINYIVVFTAGQSKLDIGEILAIGEYSPKNSYSPILLVDQVRNMNKREAFLQQWKEEYGFYENDFEQSIDNFSRVFVGKSQLNRTNQIQSKLAPDASNVSQIIGQIFEDDFKRKDFIEWVRILIPEFKNIEVRKSNIDGSFEFFLYEKSSDRPFPKYLISDGTYNILSLMAAVFQTNQPQFLCIEEPENGLHPHAIQLLVDFFREKCEDEGHHIWLNTHSQTLVRCLEIDEIILVNKINGETKAKQLTKDDNIDIKTDEAWLTNALGGGVLWSK